MARQAGYKINKTKFAVLKLNKKWHWDMIIESVNKHLNMKLMIPAKVIPKSLEKYKGKVQLLKFVRNKKRPYSSGKFVDRSTAMYEYEYSQNLSETK